MAFEGLTEKISATFKKLRGKGRLKEADVKEAMREIRMAARQDYDGFYDLEINLRRVQNAPPFGDIAVITVSGQEETAVLRGAAKFRDSLNACLRDSGFRNEICTVLGPAPCAVPKINYHFRYQLTLRCQLTKNLRLLLAYLLRQFSQDKANRGVNAFIDVNGYE